MTETQLRTTFLDYDARRDPKTNCFCIRCQKDIMPGQPRRAIHLINGGSTVLHPGDEDRYVSDDGEMGFHEIGMDCARRIGLEFTHPPEVMAAFRET